jgi:hypothetical protein
MRGKRLSIRLEGTGRCQVVLRNAASAKAADGRAVRKVDLGMAFEARSGEDITIELG